MKYLKFSLILLILALAFTACNKDDDDDNGGVTPDVELWHGDWLSAGANVAPLLVTLFNYDSVMVTMNDDNTLTLDSHVAGGAWTSQNGTYTVTESATGTVHEIYIVYPTFEQQGIIEVTEGTPDVMQLEVVQVVPDIGATPRTPATGFGSDPTLGTINIQTYERTN